MRVILILALIVIGMALLGWLTFTSNRTGVGVTVETEKIQADTARMAEQGEEILDRAGHQLQEAVHTKPESTDESVSGPLSDAGAPVTP